MPTVTRSIESRKITTFTCVAENAEAILLAVSFNGWNLESTPMRKRESGEWTAELELPPGTHEYRFVVNGQWTDGPECVDHEVSPNCVPNSFGSKNQKLQIQ